MSEQISRNNGRLNLSGRISPNVGGGWTSSRYNEIQFVSKANKIGVKFKKQNAGHYKAVLKDCIISDSITISLHNPTTEAAKDMIKYVSKYLIIKISYSLLNKIMENDKNFAYHENLLFSEGDINYDYLKDERIRINRNSVIEYVKRCFMGNKKINFNQIKNISIENLKENLIK